MVVISGWWPQDIGEVFVLDFSLVFDIINLGVIHLDWLQGLWVVVIMLSCLSFLSDQFQWLLAKENRLHLLTFSPLLFNTYCIFWGEIDWQLRSSITNMQQISSHIAQAWVSMSCPMSGICMGLDGEENQLNHSQSSYRFLAGQIWRLSIFRLGGVTLSHSRLQCAVWWTCWTPRICPQKR